MNDFPIGNQESFGDGTRYIYTVNGFQLAVLSRASKMANWELREHLRTLVSAACRHKFGGGEFTSVSDPQNLTWA